MAGLPTKWILVGRSSYPEFQEVVNKSTAGALVSQAIQKRNVYNFRRYRIEAAPTSLPDSKIGETAQAAALSGYTSDIETDAGTINTGEKREYVCVSDDHTVGTVGASFVKRNQAWEMRGEWEDYTWPVAP